MYVSPKEVPRAKVPILYTFFGVLSTLLILLLTFVVFYCSIVKSLHPTQIGTGMNTMSWKETVQSASGTSEAFGTTLEAELEAVAPSIARSLTPFGDVTLVMDDSYPLSPELHKSIKEEVATGDHPTEMRACKLRVVTPP